MSFNTITYTMNLNHSLNLDRYVGGCLIYKHSYSSDVVPRIGEIISIRNGDFKNMEDSYFTNENKKHFFNFNELFGDYEFNSQDYEIKSVKHSKGSYSELSTDTAIEIIPTQATIDKWISGNSTQKFIDAFNKHVDHIKSEREKEEERNKIKLERRKKMKKIFTLGILK